LGDNPVTLKFIFLGAECLSNNVLCTDILFNDELVSSVEKSVGRSAYWLVVQNTPYSAQLDTFPICPVSSTIA